MATRRRSAPLPRRLGTPAKGFRAPVAVSAPAAAAQHADTSRRRASRTRSPTRPRDRSRREHAGDEPARQRRAYPAQTHEGTRRRSAPLPRRLGTPAKGFRAPVAVSAPAAAAQHADTSRRRASRTRSPTRPRDRSRREHAGDEPARQLSPKGDRHPLGKGVPVLATSGGGSRYVRRRSRWRNLVV